MNKPFIPMKYLALIEQEIGHYVNCKHTDTCERCSKLIKDIRGLKLK